MAKAKSINMASLSYDLGASALLGAIAGVFASITLYNLGFLNQEFFGFSLSPALVLIFFIGLCMLGIVVGRFLKRLIPIMYQLAKFGEAGGLNFLVDLGVLNLLILITAQNTGIYYSAFKAISFLVAVTNSYFWNKMWVFWGHKKQDQTKEVGKFVIASLMGLVLNVLIASVVVFAGPSLMPSISSNTWATLGSVVGSLSAMIFNFVLYKIWVFQD